MTRQTKDTQGRYHSFDGEPAIITSDGTKFWYQHGKRHRDNGPAIIYSDGDKYWYHHGERHRENGPAIEYNNGNKEWYRHGKLHRENGPAIEYRDDDNKYWFIHGKECTLHEWIKLSSLSEEEKTELVLSHD